MGQLDERKMLAILDRVRSESDLELSKYVGDLSSERIAVLQDRIRLSKFIIRKIVEGELKYEKKS